MPSIYTKCTQDSITWDNRNHQQMSSSVYNLCQTIEPPLCCFKGHVPGDSYLWYNSLRSSAKCFLIFSRLIFIAAVTNPVSGVQGSWSSFTFVGISTLSRCPSFPTYTHIKAATSQCCSYHYPILLQCSLLFFWCVLMTSNHYLKLMTCIRILQKCQL